MQRSSLPSCKYFCWKSEYYVDGYCRGESGLWNLHTDGHDTLMMDGFKLKVALQQFMTALCGPINNNKYVAGRHLYLLLQQ